MSHSTPLRGRCPTPILVDHGSARKPPARELELPGLLEQAGSTQPDELLPARIVDASADQALRDTRKESERYLSFARKLSEEVVVRSSDGRREPTL